ncbi:hypothetical protein GQX74_010875 [Glossina fuscipes]|nr:hypothetical protein GQX74_010875 [Glossina fuscipes]
MAFREQAQLLGSKCFLLFTLYTPGLPTPITLVGKPIGRLFAGPVVTALTTTSSCVFSTFAAVVASAAELEVCTFHYKKRNLHKPLQYNRSVAAAANVARRVLVDAGVADIEHLRVVALSFLTDDDDPDADDEIAEVSDDEGELDAAADDSMLVQQKTLQQHEMGETWEYCIDLVWLIDLTMVKRSSSSSSSKVLFVQLSSCIAESKASSDFLQLSFDEGLAEERLVPRLEASIIEEVEELSLFLTALPKILYKKITYRSVLLDGPSRIASVGTVLGGYLCSISMASRSTLGSSCIKLYWYRAAVDIFLLDLLRGFMLNPGIEAKTSRIVDACVIAVGSCAAEDMVLVVVFVTTAEAAAIAALACCCCIRRLLLPLLDGLQLLAELLAWPTVVLAVSLILLAAIVMVVDFLSGSMGLTIIRGT